MAKNRGKEHTTLTETAQEVVSVLKLQTGVKMIAPGMIKTTSRKGSGNRFVTVVYTNAGFELIISGQSAQNVAVHTEKRATEAVVEALKTAKKLRNFEFKERTKKPGV